MGVGYFLGLTHAYASWGDMKCGGSCQWCRCRFDSKALKSLETHRRRTSKRKKRGFEEDAGEGPRPSRRSTGIIVYL